jgi:hypothetical protein
MSSKARIALAVLGLSASLAGAAATAKPEYEMDANGELQIGTDGEVIYYRMNSQLAGNLAAIVDKDVRRWRFEPIVVDGHAVVAKTKMRLHLKAEPIGNGDNFSVRIVEVVYGEPKRTGRMKPPRYPPAAVHAGLGAKVVLSVNIDASGDVVAIEPYQTSLSKSFSNDREADRWRQEFERSSILAANAWKFDLTQSFNGKAIGSTVLVPVDYALVPMGARLDARWKSYVPGPAHTASWVRDSRMAGNIDVSSLGDGEARPIESRFHLKDDVIGKAL